MTRCFTIAAAAASMITILPAARAVAQTPPVTGKTRAFLDPLGKLWEVPGRDGLQAWFAATDTDHDGKIDRAEIAASAKAWFATLDINHDGVIDPDEETAYEADRSGNHGAHGFTSSGFGAGGDEAPHVQEGGLEGGYGRRGHHRGGRGGRGGVGGFDGGDRTGALMDVANPVISADINLDRGVSLTEAVNAATRRLSLLDVDGDGELSREEAIERRNVQQGNAREKAHPPTPVDQQQPADGG